VSWLLASVGTSSDVVDYYNEVIQLG
jgi:hypothetical protein